MDIEKVSGNKRVKIEYNPIYKVTDFATMRNGRQWTGFEVDRELLEMMRDVINEYLAEQPPTEPQTRPPVGEFRIKEILNTVVLGDALELARRLPDESVHCIITSPPY